MFVLSFYFITFNLIFYKSACHTQFLYVCNMWIPTYWFTSSLHRSGQPSFIYIFNSHTTLLSCVTLLSLFSFTSVSVCNNTFLYLIFSTCLLLFISLMSCLESELCKEVSVKSFYTYITYSCYSSSLFMILLKCFLFCSIRVFIYFMSDTRKMNVCISSFLFFNFISTECDKN